MAEPLEIQLKLDRSDAKQGIQDQAEDEKKLVDQTKKHYTDEEIAAIAKNRRIGEMNEARVGKAIEGLKREEFANASLGNKIGMLVGPINKVAIAYQGLGMAGTALKAIGDMWMAQRKDIEESVDRVVNYKEKILELAALKDKIGNPDPVHAEILNFRAQTGQTAEQADNFQKGALNTGQSSVKGGFISQDEFDKLMTKAGRYQAALGADPKAIGELVGVLPAMIGKQNQNADEVFRRMAGIFQTLQQGGSDLGPGVRAFKENAALLGDGTIKTPEKLAAITSAYSVNNSGREATLVQQLIRATNLGQLKQSKTGAEGSIASSAYYKSIGVNDQMEADEVAMKVAEDVAREQAKLKGVKNPNGTDKKLNIQQYLATKGFEGEETITPLLEISKSLNSGQFGKSFGQRTTEASAPTLAEANAITDDFMRSDVMGKRIGELAKDQADTSVGGKAAAFDLQSRRLAFETLRATPGSKVSGKPEGYLDSYTWEGKVLDKRQEMLIREAKRVGVNTNELDDRGFMGVIGDMFLGRGAQKMLGMGGNTGMLGGSIDARLFSGGQQSRSEYAYNLAEQIKAKGGNPLDNTELIRLQKEAVESSKRQEALLQKIVPQGPVNGAPTPQPASIVQPGPRANLTR